MKRGVLSWLGLLAACRLSASSVDAGATQPPEKFEPLARVVEANSDASIDERDALFRVVPLTVTGPPPPTAAAELVLDAERVTRQGAPFSLKTLQRDDVVLLSAAGETYLAQAASTLSVLDDVGAAVFLKHPQRDIAWPIDLRDEATFQSWIDDPEPGKVRVIQRADGFEIQTNLGKLPGFDPRGPTVPIRGGEMDLSTLAKGLERVAKRFKTKEVCFVPSFGTALTDVSRALAANWNTANSAWFPRACLVYPRPPRGGSLKDRTDSKTPDQ
jgi:hypothetical protein